MISDNSHLIVVNNGGISRLFYNPLFPARELMAHLHRKRIGAVHETAEKSSAFSTWKRRCIVSSPARLLFSFNPSSAFIPRREALISSVANDTKVFFFCFCFFFSFTRASINRIDTSAYFLVHSCVYGKFNASPSVEWWG